MVKNMSIDKSIEEFELWFESMYGRKPIPSTKNGDKPHTSYYMTMFADGAWKGWKESSQRYIEKISDLEIENRNLQEKIQILLSKLDSRLLP
jgi:hypothetical protein